MGLPGSLSIGNSRHRSSTHPAQLRVIYNATAHSWGNQGSWRRLSSSGRNWNCQVFLGRNPWPTYLPILLRRRLCEQQLGRMLVHRVDPSAFSKKYFFFHIISKAEETVVLVHKWKHGEPLWEDVSWHRRMGWGCISNSVELSCWQGNLKTLEWTCSQTLGRAYKEG